VIKNNSVRKQLFFGKYTAKLRLKPTSSLLNFQRIEKPNGLNFLNNSLIASRKDAKPMILKMPEDTVWQFIVIAEKNYKI